MQLTQTYNVFTSFAVSLTQTQFVIHAQCPRLQSLRKK